MLWINEATNPYLSEVILRDEQPLSDRFRLRSIRHRHDEDFRILDHHSAR